MTGQSHGRLASLNVCQLCFAEHALRLRATARRRRFSLRLSGCRSLRHLLEYDGLADEVASALMRVMQPDPSLFAAPRMGPCDVLVRPPPRREGRPKADEAGLSARHGQSSGRPAVTAFAALVLLDSGSFQRESPVHN